MDKNTMIQNLARESYEKGGFNGAWLYAEQGEIVSKGALGFRDPEGTLPITEDTIFQLASVSKTFTSVAVMLLVREGKLGLEDEITKFFPEIPYSGVTVRHLLNHTSGIPDYFDDDDWFIKIWKEEKRVPGNDEILCFLRETKAKPYFAPGKDWNSNPEEYRALAGFWNGMQMIARDREPEPIQTIEELAIKDPDKSKWERFCGKCEHPEDADFIIDEVWMQDGELYARAIDEDGDERTFRLYPIGEDEFGRKGGMLALKFGDGCVMYDDLTCKKL